MAKLPQINQKNLKEIKASEPTSLAVVDDDSLKKIVSANRKTFQNVVGKNTTQIADKFTENFSDYKSESVDIFKDIKLVLDELLKVFVDNNEKIKAFFTDQKDGKKKKELDDIEDKREDEAKDGKKRSFKDIVQSVGDKAKGLGMSALAMLENPSMFLNVAKGAFFGTAFGRIVGNIIKSPVNAISTAITTTFNALIKNLPNALGAAFLANNIFNAWNKEGPDKNNSGSSNFVGNLLGSDDKNDTIWNKLSRYAGMAWAGSKAGGIFGGWGRLIGAGLGVGAAYAGDQYGDKNVSDFTQFLTDKLDGFIDVTGGKKIDREQAKTNITNSQKDIDDNTRQIDANNKKLMELIDKRNQANSSGDKETATKLDSDIKKVEKENRNLNINSDIEKRKISEYQQQIDTGDDNKNKRYGFGQVHGNLLGDSMRGVQTGTDIANQNNIFELMKPKPEDPDKAKIRKEKDRDFLFNYANEFEREKDRDDKIEQLEQRRFPGKEKDDDINLTDKFIKLDVTEQFKAIAPTVAREILENLYVEAVKPKTAQIMNEAKKVNENSENGFAKMISGMVNNVNTNMSSTNNVSNKTFISRPITTQNRSFTGYGRGE